jgi:hypothetical protein
MVLGPKCSAVVNQVLARLQKVVDRARENEPLDQADLKAMLEAQLTMLSLLDTLVQSAPPELCVPSQWPQERPTP